jgi:Dolichyl-phosphate-mannose-protein mannosyltransferase
MSAQVRKILLLALFLVALGIRCWNLGAVGLAEDEARKMEAVRSYRQGEFTANGEHPMLMKLLCTGSVLVAERWNALVPSSPISPEAALRFPLALAGGLMVFAIYLLGKELFGLAPAMIAASLWAFDIDAVALSRIAKEDALMALFFVIGNFFLLRGKKRHFESPALAKRDYLLCGASFGVMLASKYVFPYLWSTFVYYDLLRFRKEPRWRLDRNTRFLMFGCFLLGFILFNPIILNPGIIKFGLDYVSTKTLPHSGTTFNNRLYLNTAIQTFWGLPVYFYCLYILVKTPVLSLIFFLAGLVYSIRRYRDDNFFFLALTFLSWFIFISLPGGKFTRYMMTLLPWMVLLEAIGLYMAFTVINNHLSKAKVHAIFAPIIMGGLLMPVLGWQLFQNFQYNPNPSFYINSLGGGRAAWGKYFPQDDFYDAGMREALEYLCKTAPRGSQVLGSTPALFSYYTRVFHRTDLKFVPLEGLSQPFPPDPKVYVLYQHYRRYTESNYILDFCYSQLRPLHISVVHRLPLERVYFLSRDPQFARLEFWKARGWTGLLRNLAGPSEHTQTVPNGI